MKRFLAFWFGHCRKNSHLVYFMKGIARYLMPKPLCRLQRRIRLKAFQQMSSQEQAYIKERVDYYCKSNGSIFLPEDAPALEKFTYKARESYVHDYVNSTYFFDAHQYVRCFPQYLRWAYNPGDVNYMFPVPEITKSRPLYVHGTFAADSNHLLNSNNILLNLDKVRHFLWVKDPYSWEEKECRVIFRGDIKGKPHRQRFIEMWKDHPLCDLSDICTMKLVDHLKYRYIMALEGNDVASNLKWVMSSNCCAVMPRPKFETWFMEGQLIPNYHYIEIQSDYSDLIERIEYYEAHPNEAKAIVAHAHEWCSQFWNSDREDLISFLVLEKYFRETGQIK